MTFTNILLIDDDEDDREFFQSAIDTISHFKTFLALDNAAEALKKLEGKALKPDVIFLDLNMPKMNGQQFLIKIKDNADLKNIPIVIFSTSSDHNKMQELKALGARDFITKPSDLKDLIKLLQAIL